VVFSALHPSAWLPPNPARRLCSKPCILNKLTVAVAHVECFPSTFGVSHGILSKWHGFCPAPATAISVQRPALCCRHCDREPRHLSSLAVNRTSIPTASHNLTTASFPRASVTCQQSVLLRISCTVSHPIRISLSLYRTLCPV
jgi:hypothetical protein